MNLVNLDKKKGNLKLTVVEPKGNNDASNLFRNSMKKNILDKEQAQWIKARFNGYFLSE